MASLSDMERWKKLIQKAKEYKKQGRLEESLTIYRQTLEIRHHDKVVERINKIKVLQSP